MTEVTRAKRHNEDNIVSAEELRNKLRFIPVIYHFRRRPCLHLFGPCGGSADPLLP